MKLAILELCVNSQVISYDRMITNENLRIRLKGLREDSKILNRHSWLLVSIRTRYLEDVSHKSYRCSQADHIRGMKSRAHPVKQISCSNYSVAQSVLFPRCAPLRTEGRHCYGNIPTSRYSNNNCTE